jgi:hypothetical protein
MDVRSVALSSQQAFFEAERDDEDDLLGRRNS